MYGKVCMFQAVRMTFTTAVRQKIEGEKCKNITIQMARKFNTSI